MQVIIVMQNEVRPASISVLVPGIIIIGVAVAWAWFFYPRIPDAGVTPTPIRSSVTRAYPDSGTYPASYR